MEYRISRVLENEELAQRVYRLAVEGSYAAFPGQFYMLRAWENEPLLSRPISVHKVEDNKIHFIYQVCGQGTEILKSLKYGDEIKLTGPLGNGFPVGDLKGNIAIVSGGIGIAPFNYVVEKLKDNSEVNSIDIYAGFRSEVYAVDEMERWAESINIATEDGSTGYKGYVTDILNLENCDMVLCCGPEIMMNKVVKICREKGVKVLVSTEKRMACGVGACLGCTCKTKDGNKRSCKEGPVFSGDDLIL
ncbi:dihydroorotate dehydrogenase electron transfer subunit [Clostridium polynesiense]|uniref:dihydroorotate dehydrogenase electron transfer subunit n=1 Tax=Clostridium polynesiense TaxID=1325933 RepID=UPI00058AC5B3|nr:dihydroorotate dehydrogenase electron transfer subunit [Clostridium polynesiense]